MSSFRFEAPILHENAYGFLLALFAEQEFDDPVLRWLRQIMPDSSKCTIAGQPVGNDIAFQPFAPIAFQVEAPRAFDAELSTDLRERPFLAPTKFGQQFIAFSAREAAGLSRDLVPEFEVCEFLKNPKFLLNR